MRTLLFLFLFLIFIVGCVEQITPNAHSEVYQLYGDMNDYVAIYKFNSYDTQMRLYLTDSIAKKNYDSACVHSMLQISYTKDEYNKRVNENQTRDTIRQIIHEVIQKAATVYTLDEFYITRRAEITDRVAKEIDRLLIGSITHFLFSGIIMYETQEYEFERNKKQNEELAELVKKAAEINGRGDELKERDRGILRKLPLGLVKLKE